MEKEKTYRIIQDYFKDKPVKKVYVFGSYATGEQTENSDIDLIVDCEKPVGLMQLARFKADLQDKLQMKVDLGTVEGVSKQAESMVRESMAPVYEV